MTKKRTGILLDEGLFSDFKEYVKRDKGKLHGNLSESVEDALRLYLKIENDPKLKDLVFMQLEGGNITPPRIRSKIFIENLMNGLIIQL